VLVLRWFLDATRGARLAVEDQISVSTAYRYLHEGIEVLAAVAPGLRGRARSAWCAARREVDVIEHSALELRARKERAASVCARQDGPAQMGVAEVGVAQVGLGGVPSPRWRPL